MTRQQLLNLIKYNLEDNRQMFISTAKEISRDVRLGGDKELAREISKLIRRNSKITLSDIDSINFYTTKYQKEIFNVITHGVHAHMVNKIFIYGRPGTGKTMFVKEISKSINKKYVVLNLSSIIDSKLGESIKNIEKLFENKKNLLIFLDEVDSIASSRKGTRDIQEIFRVLNILLHLIDNLDSSNILIAATNLPEQIDKAFLRRFDLSVDFDVYDKNDLIEIMKIYLYKYKISLDSPFALAFKSLIINTQKMWTPVYIEKISKIFYIWNNAHVDATKAILNILISMNFGINDRRVAIFMKKFNVPLRTISYFTNIKKDNI